MQLFADRMGAEVEDVQKQWMGDTAKQRKILKANGKKLLSQLNAAQSGVEKVEKPQSLVLL